MTETTAKIPEHPAIRFEQEAIALSGMNAQVDALAYGLDEAGLKPGNAIAQRKINEGEKRDFRIGKAM